MTLTDVLTTSEQKSESSDLCNVSRYYIRTRVVVKSLVNLFVMLLVDCHLSLDVIGWED